MKTQSANCGRPRQQEGATSHRFEFSCFLSHKWRESGQREPPPNGGQKGVLLLAAP